MKFALATLSAGVAALALSSAAMAVPSASLSLTYAGSYNPTTNAFVTIDISDPTYQNSSWVHYYSLNLASFVPENTSQHFRGLLVDIALPTGAVAIGSDLIAGHVGAYAGNFPTQKVSNTPPPNGTTYALFTTNGDAGAIDGDLKGLSIINSNATAAAALKTAEPTAAFASTQAPVALGTLSFSFNQPLSADSSLGAALTPAALSFSYFDSSSADGYFTIQPPANFVNASVAIPASAVPEPASLGVLAMGGLALLARRRKA